MENIASKVIADTANSEKIFCKFLSANDTGETSGHQSGIYIPKNSVPLIFDTPGIKGQNKEDFNKIKWQDDFETDAHFKYYEQGRLLPPAQHHHDGEPFHAGFRR